MSLVNDERQSRVAADAVGTLDVDRVQPRLSGVMRLSNVLKYIFAKQEPNAPTPPPPQQLVQIAEKTLYFATVGGLTQGMIQYIYERRGVHNVQHPADQASAHAAQRDGLRVAKAYDQRKNAFQRTSHAMLRGVLRTGSLALLYFTTELAIAVYRDEYKTDMYYNTLCGGMVAGGVLGAVGQTATRSLAVMLRGGVFGTALGGMLGFPVGMMQDYLVDQLPEDEQIRRDMAITQMRMIADGEMDAVKGREFVMEMERQERRERGERVGRVDLDDVIKGIERSAEDRQRKLQAAVGETRDATNDNRESTRSWKFWKR